MTSAAGAAGWEAESAEAAGFVPDLAERMAAGVRSGLLPDLHAVVVVRDGRLVLEHYGAGRDEAWGRDLGVVRFGPEVLHDIRSVTKSVVGLVYGAALDRGLVPPPEAGLMAQFPEYPDLAGDPARAGLTVGHALGMTMGTEWNEDLPYSDPRNSEIAMERAPDRLRFVLERKVVQPPGERWTYSGGAVALIGALIARGTGRRLEEFAAEALFAPLGIDRVEWARGADGVASAASGLRLAPRDMARIGMLVLGGGAWDGRQVVSREWMEASLRPAVPAMDGIRYGMLWYVADWPVAGLGGVRRWVGGFGNGGQRLFVLPDAGLVVAITAGAYNRPDQWVAPMRVWREMVLANLRR